ncbi:VOC family protein [Streptomyces siamensis]|uniref:Glyoxalase/fosfomycin resistance/dioxygenase domain-containing protein n=1 Tax=Streptomyces siamensis TaxID=1274986 RepID=A0ABP9J2L8_9ACTN
MGMKLEVVIVSVSDVDRAKQFYEKAGFRLDIDVSAGDDFRGVQFTPPDSECSIIFGKGMTAAAPGSLDGLYLIVSDIEASRQDLVGRGIEVSEVFHDAGGLFFHGHGADGIIHEAEGSGRLAGPHPERADYGSYATFSDPDGNVWILQEVRQRAPGR